VRESGYGQYLLALQNEQRFTIDTDEL
jgi:hypothetical protein